METRPFTPAVTQLIALHGSEQALVHSLVSSIRSAEPDNRAWTSGAVLDSIPESSSTITSTTAIKDGERQYPFLTPTEEAIFVALKDNPRGVITKTQFHDNDVWIDKSHLSHLRSKLISNGITDTIHTVRFRNDVACSLTSNADAVAAGGSEPLPPTVSRFKSEHGDLFFFSDRNVVVSPLVTDKPFVELPPLQAKYMEKFMTDPSLILTTFDLAVLSSRIEEMPTEDDLKLVKVHIANLRRRLGVTPGDDRQLIFSVKQPWLPRNQVGYSLTPAA